MERLLGFLLGGLALALYVPYLFMGGNALADYQHWWIKTLGADWYEKIFNLGPGIFAGIALLLLAIRSRG